MSNIDALYDAIQKEINSISFHAAHFFRFVNHFYGCISVLEMLAQEEMLGLVDIAHIPFDLLVLIMAFLLKVVLNIKLVVLNMKRSGILSGRK